MRTVPSSESSANCPSSRGPSWRSAAAPDSPSRGGPVGKAACPSRVTCSAPLHPPRRPASAPLCPLSLGLAARRRPHWAWTRPEPRGGPCRTPCGAGGRVGPPPRAGSAQTGSPRPWGLRQQPSPPMSSPPHPPPGLSCFLFLLRHLPHSKRRQLPGLQEAAASLTSPTAPAQGLVHRPLPSPRPCTRTGPRTEVGGAGVRGAVLPTGRCVCAGQSEAPGPGAAVRAQHGPVCPQGCLGSSVGAQGQSTAPTASGWEPTGTGLLCSEGGRGGAASSQEKKVGLLGGRPSVRPVCLPQSRAPRAHHASSCQKVPVMKRQLPSLRKRRGPGLCAITFLRQAGRRPVSVRPSLRCPEPVRTWGRSARQRGGRPLVPWSLAGGLHLGLLPPGHPEWTQLSLPQRGPQ